MIDSTVHPVSGGVEATLRVRCSAVGLPTWRFSADARLLDPPGEAGSVGAWLRARPIELAVERAVKQWGSEPEPALVLAFPGCWLIPIIESRRRKRSAYIVAMAIGPEALDAEQFEQACAAAHLDSRSMRAALAPLATFSQMAAQRTASFLAWCSEDLEAMSGDRAALGRFSRELAESYEEISLLYKLGQSMNELVHPEKFIRLVTDELQATLAFEWIAVRFVDNPRAARAMSDRLLHTGVLPCPETLFLQETARRLDGLAPGQRVVLDGDARGALAGGESQVLIHPVVRDGLVVGAVFAGDQQGEDHQVSSVDMKLLDAAAGYLSILLDNAFLYDDQQLMFMGTLEALTASIDAKDPYTCGHSERVAHLAAALAIACGRDEEEAERIRVAGLVHDVGKIGVPEAVLCKTGKLTDEEYALIKEHPEIGYHILKDIPQLDDVLPGVLYHHERFDGRGYPEGRPGADIPLIARIIGLVDSFDAMSSNRTYRAAMPRPRVLQELRTNAGTQFDPELVEAFARVDLRHYDELVARHHAQAAQGSLRVRKRGAAA